MDITHDPITLAAVKASAGGTPIGGVIYMHPMTTPLYTSPKGDVFLRSGFMSTEDQATYPDAYAALTPYYQAWTAGGSARVTSQTVLAVATNGSAVVAVNSQASSGPFARYSADGGLTWANGSNGFAYASYSTQSVIWDAATGLFIAVMRYHDGSYFQYAVYTSPTGATWTNRLSGYGYLEGVRRVGSVLVLVGNASTSPYYSTIWTSTDGITWTSRMSRYAETSASTCVLVGGLYIATGPNTYTSPDAVTWTLRTSGSPAPANMSAAIGTVCLIVNGTGLRSTSDGITWTYRVTASGFVGVTVQNGIAFAWTTTGVLYRSVDGLTWTTTSIPGITADTTVFWVASISQWILVVGKAVRTSTDGVIWLSHLDSPQVAKFTLDCGQKLLTVTGTGDTSVGEGHAVGINTEQRVGGFTAYMRIK
jgi:hypothetical protein